MAAGSGTRKGDAAHSKKNTTDKGPANDAGASNVQPHERPRRSATTAEARLAHMLGNDSGELAAWLTKNPEALAKAKAAVATAAGQPPPQQNDSASSLGKRKRPEPMKNLYPDPPSDDEENEEVGVDVNGTDRARRENSLELSGSEYGPDEDGEDGGEESDDAEDDDVEEEDVVRELTQDDGKTRSKSPSQSLQGGQADGDADSDRLNKLLAEMPGNNRKKKNKTSNGKDKAGKSRAIIPLPSKEGGKSGGNRRSAAGQLVLNAASPAPDCDINLLLVSHLKMQQVQAEQLARNDRIEKMVSQLLNCIKRRPGTTQSPEPATPSASITQQSGVPENQLGLLDKLKANPRLLTSAKSTVKLLASDAVNLSILTSGVADSELMMSNTKLALRVGPDPEQEELFTELYDDFIQAHQMDKFRQKRGQIVSTIRSEGTKQYQLPANGTEDWSKITTELLTGDTYRKAGTDPYGDVRFRTVLAKTCGVDVDQQPVPEQLVVTLARLALVEVVLELQFRGVKRLEKQEAKMLHLREEALAGEPRASAFVVVVAPEDPSVCPMRLQSRAAERARALAALPEANENGQSNEDDQSN